MKIVKILLVYSMMIGILFGAKVTSAYWQKENKLSQYLLSENISLDILDKIPKNDKKYITEIRTNQLYYELKDSNGTLLQSLIPIGDEMQIQLAKDYDSDDYSFDIIPIKYDKREFNASVVIQTNISTDVSKTLHIPYLGRVFTKLLKGVIDSKKLRKGDKAFCIYTQKIRMGKPYLIPKIEMAMVHTRGKDRFIYADKDGYGYSSSKSSQPIKTTKSKSKFGMPLRHVRITSTFSYRRFHPILKRYRPHHGTDFGARRGTPLLSVADGRISFSGRMGGYGNVVKIKHAGGYESLYAHQSRRRAKRGQKVKKGQIIGYVGSTGRSTGPHLHFGLMRYGRWIDPMRVLGKKYVKSKTSRTIYKKVDIKNPKEKKRRLIRYIKSQKI